MYRVVSRIHVVCDRYDMEDSIKSAERAGGGGGGRWLTCKKYKSTNTRLPKERINMLSNPRNKENIADFLCNDWVDTGKTKLRESQSWR